MDVSIVILNYKTAKLVAQCIKGIRSISPQVSYEIIVVDNNSGERDLAILRQIKDINLIINQSNDGFAKGNNKGLRQARGKYVLVMNPDIVLLEGAVDKLAQYLNQHSNVGIVGPKLLNPDRTLQYSSYRFPHPMTWVYRRTVLGRASFGKKELRRFTMMDWDHNNTKDVDWLLAACIMIRVEVLQKLNYFDERFFMYLEDTDLSRRCWEIGYKVVYFPEAEVVHYYQRLSAKNLGLKSLFDKPTRIHIYSAIKYFMKYKGKALPRQV
ncbi:MAG: hypothetical protein COT81_00665 [Candidatus Buchananbacteria bacterium CG10_big_fil_rev_8_21_14_0_10_42_9]|uniref:Glycosyltransferase 2-like domain-containing protein n=1 Tax=Candidatus Buchananbacteria bacterium CG10_big_fil_rev_8_21_14_0_10_42_9 TaxID=1974526 RepID=A0A2H0W2B6_9BACT|nr:MAG: hypothetical protein COT81_00665 [Candidatus Buchananbacteria bacterium CG10_big_fil_rev_8_21_14_0_10_42_9]